MAMVPITLMGYRCARCTHQWVPMKSASAPPRVCPKCKSPYWDRERQRKEAPRGSTPATTP
jgi:DNA-directed RNA polymerase subunit RPC12/RpoP